MEGTRHEKIALIVIAYIIGFTSAFIAFGVNRIDHDNKFVPVENARAMNNASASVRVVGTTVGVGESGLYAVTAERERLLTVNKNMLNASAISSSGLSGYYNITEAEVSRDGKFIYFCEQLLETDERCDPYVYVMSDDTLHPVTFEGQTIKSPTRSHDSSWTDDNILVLNGAFSEDGEKPWNLSFTEAISQ